MNTKIDNIGVLIRSERTRRGMTQEELAEKMDVSRQTISKWEMGSAYPEMEKALLLCKLFACSLDELMRKNMQQEDMLHTFPGGGE